MRRALSGFVASMNMVGAMVALAVAAVGVLGLAAAPAFAEACLNETLRSELSSGALPDCRAYELVTPAYKEGTVMQGVFAISPDGSRLIGGSLGVLDGAGNDQLGGDSNLTGAAYELSRTGEGWSTAALTPPASRYVSNGLFDASADLESTLWELRALAPADGAQPPAVGVTDLYLEQPRGTFVEVGRATPDTEVINESGSGGAKYSYVGESADLSHVLFTTPAGLHWPFDETVEGGSTLYEYVGVAASEGEREAREPELVGVTGGVGSRSLVSRCGTRLGSSTGAERNGSMYNAISASGERVFFTAVGEDDQGCGAGGPPADELFDREEVPASGSREREMFTFAISCPVVLSQCADANFEGASRDGSRVFFTGTQKLLEGASEDSSSADSAVRGCAVTEAGTSGCNLYEDELSGSGATLTQRLVLVSGGSPDPRVQGVARISADGSHVYFVAKGVLTGSNSEGREPQVEADNLYVFDTLTEHTTFIATLAPGDAADWQRADARPALVSSTGRYLVFTSEADLKGEGVSGARPQVYQYNAQTGLLVRASIGQYGYDNDGRTPAQGFNVEPYPPQAYAYSHSDSPTQEVGVMAPEDGAVFFESPDALTSQALNDRLDTAGGLEPNIYEYRGGSVYLLSDGRDLSSIFSDPSVRLIGSDESGADVFFSTADSLVAQDTDTEEDVYDARVEGGFPPPVVPVGCEAATCQEPLSAPLLSLPSAASTAQAEAIVPAAASPAKAKTGPKPKAKKKIKRKRAKKGRKASSRNRSHGRTGR